MTSATLKHQARLQEWSVAIQDCRGSGLPVSRWCKEKGITPTTYYRWEREVLTLADDSRNVAAQNSVTFAELPSPEKTYHTVAERSATLRVGEISIDLYQKLDPVLLKSLIEALRSC